MFFVKNRLSLFFVFISFASYSQNFIKDLGNLQWLQYGNNFQFSKKWSMDTDLNLRWKDVFSNRLQYIARSSLGYKLKPEVKLSLGFAYSRFYENHKINRLEYRPYQQVGYSKKYGKLRIGHRIRIEQRFFTQKNHIEQELPQYFFKHRFRYRLSFSAPFSKKNKLFFGISNELHICAAKDKSTSILDQNRLLLGPAYRITKKALLSLSYQGLLSSGSVINTYHYYHTVFFSLKHTIQLS